MMAFNNHRALLVIAFSSVFLTLACEAHVTNLVSFISSSPDASPSPAPSPVGVKELPAVDVQGQVIKFVQKTVVAISAKTDDFFKNVVAKRLSGTECLKQCDENFESARDDAQSVLDSLSSGDFYKAAVDVDALATDVDTCNDCIKEMVGEDPEITKFDNWVIGITGDCLGELQKMHQLY
ncbi:hypothetical protein ACH5RR_010861 [Cinchona calisaya]|uniref:Pectinesterase inhibitor domain-containing protein n=1 Tax=Cinchona calisaya TaxID=153742 RepID=A0ABD3AK34_9GENT